MAELIREEERIMKTEITTVTVVGAGTMGVKIAAHALISGFTVRIYNIRPATLENAKIKVPAEIEACRQAGLAKEDPETILQRISYFTDLEKAVADADLIIETIPEKLSR